MAWISFGSWSRRTRQRSYHSRGAVSRLRTGTAGGQPETVEDVEQGRSFWRLHRVQVSGFWLMGTLGLLLLATIGLAGGGWQPDLGTLVIGVGTLALFAAPLLFWRRFQKQRRQYEEMAAEDTEPLRRPE